MVRNLPKHDICQTALGNYDEPTSYLLMSLKKMKGRCLMLGFQAFPACVGWLPSLCEGSEHALGRERV